MRLSISQQTAQSSPLFLACFKDDLTSLKALLENKDIQARRNVNEVDGSGCNALTYASSKSNMEIIQYLLFDAKIDISTWDKNVKFALHCACRKGYLDIVKFLLNSQAFKMHGNILERDEENNTLLHHAFCRFNNEQVVDYLLTFPELQRKEAICQKNNRGKTILMQSCERGSLKMTQYLLSFEKSFHIYDDDGSTLLHYALLGRNKENIDYLLNFTPLILPDYIYGKNKNRQTLLMLACASGYLDVVEHLLNLDIGEQKFNLYDVANQWDAFTFACQYEHPHIMRYLIMNKNIKMNPRCLSSLNQKQKIDVEGLLKEKENYDLYLKIQKKLPTTKETKQRKI